MVAALLSPVSFFDQKNGRRAEKGKFYTPLQKRFQILDSLDFWASRSRMRDGEIATPTVDLATWR